MLACCDGKGAIHKDTSEHVGPHRSHYDPTVPIPVGSEAHPAQALRGSGGYYSGGAAPSQAHGAHEHSVTENVMNWFGIHGSDDAGAQVMGSFNQIALGLETLYRDKLLPLERDCEFHHFHQTELPPAFFTSRPMILTVGQYSTGKTTFIQHLLGHDYPTIQIGPEPTTDRFICVCHGEQAQLIPGNALVYDQTLPFQPLSRFGNGFLSKLACARIPNPVLEGVSFVDTPGVLAGEKQRAKRGYDFEEVMTWFADHAAMIILFFDAHKLDVSDEFKRNITALASVPEKVHVILNKADIVTTQELVRVHGALMWSLGKVMNTPEVARVYMGSFWSEPLQNEELRELFEKEQEDLYRHIEQLPRQSTLIKINDLGKRALRCKAHATLLEFLREQMPTMWGYREKQEELIMELGRWYSEVSRRCQVSIGDFPPVNEMREKLHAVDLSTVRKLDRSKMKGVDELISRGIPSLLKLIPPEHEGGDAAMAPGSVA